MHVSCEPPILYLGTPVVLISTLNEDGSANLAPMSSAFWLGWRGILGLSAVSKTPQNLQRTHECVLNLPSASMVATVDKLARTTGSDPVPPGKLKRGYRFVADKFGVADLTPLASDTIAPPRVAECPVQLEAVVEATHAVAAQDPEQRGRVIVFETRIRRVHAHPEILAEGERDRIDPNKWRPLIMSFQRYYGLGPELQESTLAKIPEAMYRGPDIERVHAERAA